MEVTTLNLSSAVSLEHMPHLWKQNDILILIIDLNDYEILTTDYLDYIEMEHLKTLKSEYFKKRYIISRIVLKHILCSLLNERLVSDIFLYKDQYGGVHVHDHSELHICISYTENIVALAISKIEVGIDVELRKLLSFKKVSKYLQITSLHSDSSSNNLDHLTMWTLKEAYCKLSNKSIFSNLNKELDLNNICHSSYLINNEYILSVVTDSDQHTIHIKRLEKIVCDDMKQVRK